MRGSGIRPLRGADVTAGISPRWHCSKATSATSTITVRPGGERSATTYRFDGEAGLLFGSPPCQGFSQIGLRQLDDPRNLLHFQYLRVLRMLRPRVFLMENVPNMLTLAGGVFRRQVLAGLRHAGYANSGVGVVTASDYGVPQLRRRAIFFGVRDDLELGGPAQEFLATALLAERQQLQTVGDALADLPQRTACRYEDLPLPAPGRRQPAARRAAAGPRRRPVQLRLQTARERAGPAAEPPHQGDPGPPGWPDRAAAAWREG